MELLKNIDLSSILLTVLTTLITYLGTYLKKVCTEIQKNETVRQVIDDCVNYVEQKSKTIDNYNKYEEAKIKATNILKSKKIKITSDEMELLIESFVNCLDKENDSSTRKKCRKKIKI